MAFLTPCRLPARCLTLTALSFVRRNPKPVALPYSCLALNKVKIGGYPAAFNIRGIHCSTPSFGKKKQKYVKDAAQNEVDAVLSAQKAVKIESFAVQLLDEHGADLGVMKKKIAEQRAKDESLKLVCVDAKVRPNVYQLMTGADLVKFDKEQKRLKKENVPKEQKTVRLSMGIGPRDLEMKLKRADEWIVKGHSVYISLRSGRRMNQDDINAGQAEMFEKLTTRFGEGGVVKQALKTDTDLKVVITPKKTSEVTS